MRSTLIRSWRRYSLAVTSEIGSWPVLLPVHLPVHAVANIYQASCLSLRCGERTWARSRGIRARSIWMMISVIGSRSHVVCPPIVLAPCTLVPRTPPPLLGARMPPIVPLPVAPAPAPLPLPSDPAVITLALALALALGGGGIEIPGPFSGKVGSVTGFCTDAAGGPARSRNASSSLPEIGWCW